MKVWLALILSITIVACATNPSRDRASPGSIPVAKPGVAGNDMTGNSEWIVKSPHGYVINGPKASFGGFVGDCAGDENFLYYWECQAESAGDNYC
ncbi:hypothetical protein D1BOALGB6SA_8546 [Olavius sp. associated proteobacterium Delta 1]|nr:hypothetical protein D1BOALGB6SA_8546 [Olavius sp. associated proteobacterium Delta 1]